MKIICEAGLNWTNFNEAVLYAEKALEIGADIIKYQYVNEESPYSQMNKGEWKALKGYCDKIGIEFMATPSSKEILKYLINIGMKKVKIGSDRCNEDKIYLKLKDEMFYRLYDKNIHLISNGYYDNSDCNMYCVSLYPCDKKFIDFCVMSQERFIGFSDHTLEYNKEWCDKIKACKNIKYVEKHFKLDNDCIDSNVSLDYNKMKEFIVNIKE